MEDIKNGPIHFEVWRDEVFYLNHSCDEWVIGDIQAAKKFTAECKNEHLEGCSF